MCVSVSSTCKYVYHMCAGAQGDQKRKSDFMELELQMPVHHYEGAGTKPGFSAIKKKSHDR